MFGYWTVSELNGVRAIGPGSNDLPAGTASTRKQVFSEAGETMRSGIILGHIACRRAGMPSSPARRQGVYFAERPAQVGK